MTDFSTLSARALHTDYTALGGTKAFGSFKNKQAIIDAILELQAAMPDEDDGRADAMVGEDHDAHVQEWMTAPQDDDAPLELSHDEPQDDETADEDDDAEDDDADAEEPATDEPMGKINVKLNKVERARLRKAFGGKLAQGRWGDAVLPIRLLEKARIPHVPV